LADTVDATMHDRIRLLLALCAAKSYSDLVLGAWGCGVFGHAPRTVADSFHELLTMDFAGVFGNIVFAVFDRAKGETTYKAFRDVFDHGFG
jgi:uncharacterized protein (TIGR02452 family)